MSGTEHTPAAAADHGRRTRPARHRTVRFHKVTSADGTVVEAWSNTAEGPVVLLCNGLGANPYFWPDLLDPRCGLRVISWNHRGVGRSARPADPARVGAGSFVEDALAVLDDAGVRACAVAGWSSGVTVAFELAVRHPQRVTGLFGVAGVPGDTFSSMGAPLLVPRPLRSPLAVGVARALERAGPALTPVAQRVPMGPVTTTALRYSGFMFPSARPADVRRAVLEFLTTPMDWYGHLALAAAEHQAAPLAPLGIPASLVSGKYDVLASHHDMRDAAERIEAATYVELFGTHFLVLEQPRTVTRLLHDLVDRTLET